MSTDIAPIRYGLAMKSRRGRAILRDVDGSPVPSSMFITRLALTTPVTASLHVTSMTVGMPKASVLALPDGIAFGT
ncbi:hypothetical protein [Marivita hallyeonensis]|uniref:hypothetical protein n=1 Tax=Marivita hallyeonensis TaxID=996342 RepID=UPI0009334FE6|nr:hypothetical protein [Marivita hallyeonensis]